ncbi:hypothetical protein [Marmoricola sp. RAF53]|uniref:hypothetical protein n=1 Tax=Marmoricola sp. RAF53 TaxID=3233059 RepID=UPI003F9BE216
MNRRISIGTAAVALLAALGWAGWWWTHPTLLSEEPLGLGSGSAAPKPLAEAVHTVGVAGDPWDESKSRETITFHGFEPQFTRDGARLKVTLSVCTARTPNTVIGVVHADADDLSEDCTKVTPVTEGTTMEIGTREYLVATLAATQVGKSHLSAITVDYSRSAKHLWRHGEDRVEGGITVTATG